MGTESLSIPEEDLQDFIKVVTDGLKANPELKMKLFLLEKWCDEMKRHCDIRLEKEMKK